MQTIEQARQAVISRFISICQEDERVVAAFLGGSYARNATDAYSDIDFGLITTDEAYDDFFADREAFIRSLGTPIFLEDYDDDGCDVVFFTFSEGVECELVLGRASQFTHIHVGPHQTLLDKQSILTHVVFPQRAVPQADQIETLHHMISWFWHDLCHHFITPLARGQMWSAFGGLQDLRLACINLARLKENFSESPEGYEKVEQVLSSEQLAPLEATCCPLERGAMLHAAFAIVHFYQELAIPLAQTYGIAYPTDLERVMYDRLEQLRDAVP
jgi:predicted nucleotidyltransferase